MKSKFFVISAISHYFTNIITIINYKEMMCINNEHLNHVTFFRHIKNHNFQY